MANSAQAKKRIRQSNAARLHNKQILTRIRTFKKRTQNAILENALDDARLNLKTMTKLASRAASKNLLHKNTVARWVSRLNAAIKSAS